MQPPLQSRGVLRGAEDLEPDSYTLQREERVHLIELFAVAGEDFAKSTRGYYDRLTAAGPLGLDPANQPVDRLR